MAPPATAATVAPWSSTAALPACAGCWIRTPQTLDRLAREGDLQALEAWREYGRWLGVGLSSLIYVLTPQLVLIGGGLSAASAHFLPHALAEVEQRVQVESRLGLEIRCAALGNGAGRLGAARLALERLND